MSLLWQDGDWTVASASGGKEKTFPFEGDPDAFLTTQSFVQFFANFARLPLNSVDPDDPISYLVAESELTDLGGGVVSWNRTYARIPSARNEYESFAYTFPGFVATLAQRQTTPWALPSGTHTAVDDPGRSPKTESVTSRLLHEYFLVGANGQYDTADDIPSTPAQTYVYGAFFGSNAGGDVPDRLLWPATTILGYVNGTSPTKEAYKALVTAGSEIVAEDSKLKRWRGNIYERVTRYVVAK
jgi:hypothetical protein